MKNNKMIIALIILLIIIAAILLVGMIFMLQGNYHFGFKSTYDQLVLDETYELIYEVIEIESDASDIEIKSTNDENIRIVIYGDEEKTKVPESGSNLKITSEAKKCFGFCFNTQVSKVTIYLPKTYAGKLDVTNKYGDVEIDDFVDAEMKIMEDCGNVKILEAQIVDIENSYGDIKIGSVSKAKLNAKCGDIEIATLADGTIKNNYGDIKIEKVTEHIDIQEDCGKVKIDDLNLTADSYIKNSYGDIHIGSTSEIYFDASVSLGDIKINNNYRNAEVTLKLTNNCGDIKIDN